MRSAIYARVSTEKQEKQETVKSQVEALRKYARQNKHGIVGEYIDEGYSGELLDRPALDRLRDDAKSGIFEALLIHSPDRLSRKFVYQALLEEEIKKAGIRIVFLNRPDRSDTPEENLLNGVQGLIAEYEKAKIVERTRRGKRHKAESGRIIGNLAPYGYKYVKGDRAEGRPGRYEVIPEEAKVVRLIFKLLVDDRMSIRGIAKELTRRMISPPRGKHWRTSTLRRILTNETYIGTTYYNKHVLVEPEQPRNGEKYRRRTRTSHRLRPKDEWIAIHLPEELHIIDTTTFRQAQKQMEINSALSSRNTKYRYLLRGLVKCGACGAAYVGIAYRKKLYYRCNDRQRTFPLPRDCKVGSVRAEPLETAVWDKLTEALVKPSIITKRMQKLQDRGRGELGGLNSEAREIEVKLSGIQNEESRILDAYSAGAISIEQLKTQMAKLRSRRQALESEKQAIQTKIDAHELGSFSRRSVEKACRCIARSLNKLEDDFEGRRQLLTLLLNEVVVEGKQVRIKGVLPVESLTSGPKEAAIAFQPSGGCGRPRQRPRRRVWRAAGRVPRRSPSHRGQAQRQPARVVRLSWVPCPR